MIEKYSKKTDLNLQLAPHFKAGEFACPCPRCGEILIDDRLPALLEDIRVLCRATPVRVTSGYRCPAHNAEVAGASSTSLHMEGIAADIQISGVETLSVARTAEKALAAIGLPGGIGRYIEQAFCHIDLRAGKMRFDKETAKSPYLYHSGWTETPASRPVLRRGSRGEDVRDMQRRLIALEYALPKWGADGDFGDETENAVKGFQKAAGLAVDGVCGPKTWAALEE